jgi:hypothetical protein
LRYFSLYAGNTRELIDKFSVAEREPNCDVLGTIHISRRNLIEKLMRIAGSQR